MGQITKLDAADLFEMLFTFLAEKEHPNPEQAIEKVAQYWLRGDVILDEDDFSEEFEYLQYYNKLTGTPMPEIVREALADWLDCTYPVRVGRIEDKLGIPSTLVPDPPRGERIETV